MTKEIRIPNDELTSVIPKENTRYQGDSSYPLKFGLLQALWHSLLVIP